MDSKSTCPFVYISNLLDTVKKESKEFEEFLQYAKAQLQQDAAEKGLSLFLNENNTAN